MRETTDTTTEKCGRGDCRDTATRLLVVKTKSGRFLNSLICDDDSHRLPDATATGLGLTFVSINPLPDLAAAVVTAEAEALTRHAAGTCHLSEWSCSYGEVKA